MWLTIWSALSARDELLDAAFRILAEDSGAVKPDAVAREAGVSKALVFHHFGTREGLLDAMAARVLAETQRGLARLSDDYPNPRERLAALARTLLEEPVDMPRAAARRVLLFWLADDAQGQCRGALRDALLADYVRAVVREGVATGALRPGADADAVARLLLARWHGATVVFAAGGAVDFETEAERLVDEIARAAFPEGMAGAPSPR